ncbi:hypothetical protein [Lentzea jiangxiensis]|uniref:Uncharacterized protein n=1 Tax=Lentzea jiangxiensis TaxID=641025 RepID=A0A1H0S6P0_9PSEU|nr:hypothetical protein [Lentzea jiangxiensis]SDP37491.1 hypothetical protein SAMN05421507_107262 [Lentzea jiangxiensis]
MSISVSEGAVLARAARVAIDRRADYPLAARLLVELRHLHHELGLDFTSGFERFTASYGHSEELMRALRRVGL